jgi:hypothetical protein
MVPLQHPPCRQAHEVPCTLSIACWPEGECTDGMRCHGAVVLFVSLDVLAVFKPAMSCIVEPLPSHNLSGTHVIRHSINLLE